LPGENGGNSLGRSVTDTEVQEFIANSDKLLSCYKNIHQGKRCVIIGNGPSLNKMDLSFLKNEISFGLNRIYLGFEKWNFMPTYYVSVNKLVIEQSMNEILKIPVPKFIALAGLPYLPVGHNVIALKTAGLPLDDVTPFSVDPHERIWEGFTVTFVALQLAYYMGFGEVVLIGVDHHFSDSGPANREVISQGDDHNHFHPKYFGKGVSWHLPDLINSEVAYRVAKIAFEADGRRIIDATVDGKLTIFPKVDYKELLIKKCTFDLIYDERKRKIDAMTRDAECLVDKGDITGALQDSLKVIEYYPEAAEAHNNLCVLHCQSGEFGESLKHIIHTLRINPESREAVINCSKLLALAGEQEKLRLICKRFLGRGTPDRDVVSLLEAPVTKKGTSELFEANNLSSPEAEEGYEQLLLLISIGSLLVKGDHKEAIRHCVGLLKYPDSPFLLDRQAELQILLGNRMRAKALLLEIINKWPNHTSAYNNLALLNWKEGDIKKALQYFTKALKNAPDRNTVLNCGKLLVSLGKPEEAKSLYSSYMKKYPDDKEISCLLNEIGVVTGNECDECSGVKKQ